MKNKGFTLIELLVVVLIIGILAGTALPQYTKAVEKSRATEAVTLVSNIAKAEAVYALGTNSFTNDLNSLDVQVPSINATDSSKSETKNFDVQVVAVNPLQVVATRKGTNNVYSIVGAMPLNGNLQIWCKAGAGYAAASALGSNTEAAKTCKSIANGDANGMIIK